MYHDYDDEPSCPECGQYDHGFNMSDVRTTLKISTCTEGEEACDEGYCEDEPITIKVTVRRVWDRTCSTCGGGDYRCVYDLTLDGAKLKTFNSESDADSYAEKVFPSAKPPERDLAWESERGLRIAEGWGC